MLSTPALVWLLGDQVFLYVVPPLLILAFAGVLAWILGYQATSQPLRLVHVWGDYLWLDGTHAEFLRHLPRWPQA
jgi:hypothetical protein